ncbi:MAG: thiolase family protein [Acidimicrobiia bacterium]
MTEAVIVAAARTPIARARKGSLVDVDAFRLAEIVVGEALARSGIAQDDIDDIVLGESVYGGGDIARYVAVRLGLLDAAGIADNRHCASGLSAVQFAAATIRAGMDSVVVAGGTQSSSTSPRSWRAEEPGGEEKPWVSPPAPEMPNAPVYDMSITVGENTAQELGITRRDVDEWAVYSQAQAIHSIDTGAFEAEIVPVEYTDREGNQRVFSVDEHPRRGITVETLADLKPLHPELANPTVTAGNASGINDAAAALVVTSDEYASAHGLRPLARVVSWANVGVEPARTGMGPTVAIPKALARAGLTLDDIDLFEINEAFCSVPVAAVRVLGIDPTILNVNGSGCSLGHPIATTGARMVVTMVNELRRRGKSHGLLSMCAAGGMGSALVVEAMD